MRRPLAALLLVAALAGCSHIVVLHDPLSAAEHNDLGVAYESRQQLELAAREYQKALRQDRHFATARVNLGNVAAKEGRWSRAEACYRRALRDRPADPDAMNNLAMALLRQGRGLAEAESLASSAFRANESDSSYRATLEEVRRAKR
jgi:tetratricopeptide (TPR) repeat protein